MSEGEEMAVPNSTQCLIATRLSPQLAACVLALQIPGEVSGPASTMSQGGGGT